MNGNKEEFLIQRWVEKKNNKGEGKRGDIIGVTRRA